MDSAGDTAPDLLGCIALALDGLGGGRILFFLESIAGRGIPAMRLLVALARSKHEDVYLRVDARKDCCRRREFTVIQTAESVMY
jgi:hypothetical protein